MCELKKNYFVGDSLSGHNGMKFCTKDQDNDTSGKNCANLHPGGWWFGACFNNHLNGLYQKSALKTWNGVIWFPLENMQVSLKSARMMFRAKE